MSLHIYCNNAANTTWTNHVVLWQQSYVFQIRYSWSKLSVSFPDSEIAHEKTFPDQYSSELELNKSVMLEEKVSEPTRLRRHQLEQRIYLTVGVIIHNSRASIENRFEASEARRIHYYIGRDLELQKMNKFGRLWLHQGIFDILYYQYYKMHIHE